MALLYAHRYWAMLVLAGASSICATQSYGQQGKHWSGLGWPGCSKSSCFYNWLLRLQVILTGSCFPSGNVCVWVTAPAKPVLSLEPHLRQGSWSHSSRELYPEDSSTPDGGEPHTT